MENNKLIASHLLKINAVVLSPEEPFTWASGIKSPVYCDNRLILAYPDVRKDVIAAFVNLIQTHYPDADVIAGTATAGIPHAALIAEAMGLPMAYIRSSAKSHGRKKQIEGIINPGQKVVVIDDLISTGGSVLTAAHAVEEIGAEVLGVAAIFTYQLPKADTNFTEAKIALETLTDFETLIHLAVENGTISGTQLEQLKKWYADPTSEDWQVQK
ncbi:orotate phosphoribosyltransferase [Sporolactobacillus laevolacticus]|uniref:Orotate phosphoribosyltransferase n=1 Tax=Sporolactobacillus laevolacticus DSM 442 TaxID=1395513 RepID=V6IZU4_9BACL|nr:orotate phosphoribosyltransferase [Sporolactobacillus laevolacticus]EST13118.1 orotate phosphoribosyltransferase [Sporolactobacillus laevolacticus DSM 442]